MSDAIKALAIGEDVLLTKLYTPANLPAPTGSTYNITLLQIKKNAGAFGTADLVVDFNEAANTELTDVTIIVI